MEAAETVKAEGVVEMYEYMEVGKTVMLVVAVEEKSACTEDTVKAMEVEVEERYKQMSEEAKVMVLVVVGKCKCMEAAMAMVVEVLGSCICMELKETGIEVMEVEVAVTCKHMEVRLMVEGTVVTASDCH